MKEKCGIDDNNDAVRMAAEINPAPQTQKNLGPESPVCCHDDRRDAALRNPKPYHTAGVADSFHFFMVQGLLPKPCSISLITCSTTTPTPAP
jgi:hypothetical protein